MTYETPLNQLPPVTCADRAADRWRLVLGMTGVRERELWVQVFDADGAQRAPVVLVDELPVDPEPVIVENLLGAVTEVLLRETSGIGSVAVALARTETPEVQASDLAWASAVQRAAGDLEVRLLSVHLVAVTDGPAFVEEFTIEQLA